MSKSGYEIKAPTSAKETGKSGVREDLTALYKAKLQNAVENADLSVREARAQAEREAEKETAALREQYQNTQRQLYRDYMGSKKNIGQQLAGQGYTGGLSESARVRLETDYGEELNENERTRLRQEREIAAEAARSVQSAQSASDKAAAQAEQDYFGSLVSLAEKEYTQTLSDERKRADKLAEGGDFSGYLELGFTQEETDYLTRLWLKKNEKLKKTWIRDHPETAARLGYI